METIGGFRMPRSPTSEEKMFEVMRQSDVTFTATGSKAAKGGFRVWGFGL